MAKVEISAEARGAAQTLRRIHEAIAAIGDEAAVTSTKLKDLKLPPDLKRQALEQQAAFEGLLGSRMGRNLNRRIVESGQAGREFHQINWSPLGMDPAYGRRMRQQTLHIIGSGGLPQARAPQTGGAGRATGSAVTPADALGGMGRMASRLFWPVAGLMGLGGVLSTATSAVQNAEREAIDIDRLQRSISDLSTGFFQLRDDARSVGKGLQMTFDESRQVMAAYARASGETDSEQISSEAHIAAAVARSFGLDPMAMANQQGRMQFLGGERKDYSPRQLALIFAEAISAGDMFAKADEVIGAIQRYAERGVAVGSVPNIQAMAGLMTQMNASGQPVLRGQFGENIIARMESALRGGSRAGEAGEVYLFRALNAMKGVNGVFDVGMLKSAGLFASPLSVFGKRDDQGNLLPGQTGLSAESVIGQIMERFIASHRGMDGERKADEFGRLMNLEPLQARAFLRMYQDMGKHEFGEMAERLAEQNIQVKGLGFTAIKELGIAATGDMENLQGLRTKYLARDDISYEEKTALGKADTTEELRAQLLEIIPQHGRPENLGMRALAASTAIKDEITKVGAMLLPPLVTMKEHTATIVSTLPGMVGALVGDEAAQEIREHQRAQREMRERANRLDTRERVEAKQSGLAGRMEELVTQLPGGKNAVKRIHDQVAAEFAKNPVDDPHGLKFMQAVVDEMAARVTAAPMREAGSDPAANGAVPAAQTPKPVTAPMRLPEAQQTDAPPARSPMQSQALPAYEPPGYEPTEAAPPARSPMQTVTGKLIDWFADPAAALMGARKTAPQTAMQSAAVPYRTDGGEAVAIPMAAATAGHDEVDRKAEAFFDRLSQVREQDPALRQSPYESGQSGRAQGTPIVRVQLEPQELRLVDGMGMLLAFGLTRPETMFDAPNPFL